MAWAPSVVTVVRDNALASVTVDYINTVASVVVETQRLTHRVSDLEGLKQVVRNQIAAFAQRDALLAAPPVGALDVSLPVPTPPTPQEIADAAARQSFADDLRTLRQLTAAVTLGIFATPPAQIAALQSSLNARLVARPAFFLPLLN